MVGQRLELKQDICHIQDHQMKINMNDRPQEREVEILSEILSLKREERKNKNAKKTIFFLLSFQRNYELRKKASSRGVPRYVHTL